MRKAEVLSVASSADEGDDPDETHDRVEETAAGLREAGIDVTTTVVESDDVIGTIVERSSEHDLTVVGSTREGVLQQFVFGAIPEEVARKADDTVLVAKRNVDLPSQTLRSIRRRLP